MSGEPLLPLRGGPRLVVRPARGKSPKAEAGAAKASRPRREALLVATSYRREPELRIEDCEGDARLMAAALRELGFALEHAVLNAHDFGVPQARRRSP